MTLGLFVLVAVAVGVTSFVISSTGGDDEAVDARKPLAGVVGDDSTNDGFGIGVGAGVGIDADVNRARSDADLSNIALGRTTFENEAIVSAQSPTTSTTLALAPNSPTAVAVASAASTTGAPTTAASTTAASTTAASTTAAPSTAAPTTAAPTTAAPSTTVRVGDGSVAQQILNMTNIERSFAGCRPLTLNAQLNRAAQGHSEDMEANDYFGHTGSDGSSPGDRARSAGYAGTYIGENIAVGHGVPEVVMNDWMNSSGHRANILNCSFTHLGVGLGQGGYWTQLFGKS